MNEKTIVNRLDPYIYKLSITLSMNTSSAINRIRYNSSSHQFLECEASNMAMTASNKDAMAISRRLRHPNLGWLTPAALFHIPLRSELSVPPSEQLNEEMSYADLLGGVEQDRH